MNALKMMIAEQIKALVPEGELLNGRMNVGDKSYSIEFFVSIDGKRYQCYDLIDLGYVKEKDFDQMAKRVADCVRKSAEYRVGEGNRICF